MCAFKAKREGNEIFMNARHILKVLAVILGTMIGAGFASGKEIYNFFARFGTNGIIGILISGILTGAIIYLTNKIIINKRINTNMEFITTIKGGKLLYNIVNIFLIMSFYIMIAGFSTFFKQEYNIPVYVISTILCILMYFILSSKIEKIVKCCELIVPILIVISLYIVIKYNINCATITVRGNKLALCIINAILYSSYNCITLIPMLITLKKYISNSIENVIISTLSSLLIIILTLGIYGVLIKSNINISEIDLPIISIINNNVEKHIYSVAIEIAILTSAISAGYGVLENIRGRIKERDYKKVVAVMCLIGIPISGLGFGNLIGAVYPFFGLLGLIQICLIVSIRSFD